MPKTVYCNLRLFPMNIAVRLPVFVGIGCHIREVHRGIVEFGGAPKLFALKFGWPGDSIVPLTKSTIRLRSGKILIKGDAGFAQGCVINLDGGTLTIGNHFWSNPNMFLPCSHEITIGDDCLAGWNVFMFDGDGHTVYQEGKAKTGKKFIHIGDHVWICAYVKILKRTTVSDGSIVALNSLVTRQFTEPNVLIAGSPANVISHSIEWEH